MVFRRFDPGILLIGTISSVTGALFIWSLSNQFMRATSVGLFIVWILMVFYLIQWLHRLRQDIERFLNAILAGDASMTLPEKGKGPFRKSLNHQFNELNANFRLVRKEKEQEHHFFINAINHIGTGLLAFDEKGKIYLSNRALHTLLGIHSITEINHLRRVSPDLPGILMKLHPGEQYLLKVPVPNGTMYLSMVISCFKMDRITITLASFRDISRDLDNNEMEAYQKLSKVVIHEITGSVVPFRLLSSKLLSQLRPEGNRKSSITLKGEALENAVSVLEIIQERSSGLARFVDAFKTLSELPSPEKQTISIQKLFAEVELYFSEVFRERSIQTKTHVQPDHLHLKADVQLVFQVLVNLIDNAAHAMDATPRPCLSLHAFHEEQQLIIEVMDNGRGIPHEIIESIFVPFFTTREGGSGIGLSLARQIMTAHNGSILPFSEPGKGTTFRLVFPT